MDVIRVTSRGRRRPVRGTALAAAVALVGASVAGVVGGGAGPAGAAEIDDLRAAVANAHGAATAATARYMDAVNRLEAVEVEIGRVEQEIAAKRDRVAALGLLARERAVTAYTQRGVDLAGDLEFSRPMDRVRRKKMLEQANARDNDAIDQLKTATEALAARERELRSLRTDAREARDRLAAEQAELDKQLVAAQQALAAFEERLRREEAARQERERQLLLAAQQAAAAARSTPSAGGGTRSGGGYTAGGLVCPIRGPVSFIDSWGYPRATTGWHQGVDLMSPRGTPNVAVVSGSVTFRTGGTSGLGAYLTGDDGNVYWYFHFDAYEGSSRRVAQGEVLGYTGNTGDAIGTAPHTHFEIHPGGGPAVNPYPTVAQIC